MSTDPEPVFITNAHVVTNAQDVKLQLLVHGNQKWEAEAALITLPGSERLSFLEFSHVIQKHPLQLLRHI